MKNTTTRSHETPHAASTGGRTRVLAADPSPRPSRRPFVRLLTPPDEATRQRWEAARKANAEAVARLRATYSVRRPEAVEEET